MGFPGPAHDGRFSSDQMQSVQERIPRSGEAVAERLFASMPELRGRAVL